MQQQLLVTNDENNNVGAMNCVGDVPLTLSITKKKNVTKKSKSNANRARSLTHTLQYERQMIQQLRQMQAHIGKDIDALEERQKKLFPLLQPEDAIHEYQPVHLGTVVNEYNAQWGKDGTIKQRKRTRVTPSSQQGGDDNGKKDGRNKPSPWILWKTHTANICVGIQKYQHKAKASSSVWKSRVTDVSSGIDIPVKAAFTAHCNERGYDKEMSKEDQQEVFDSWFNQYPELKTRLEAFTEEDNSLAATPAVVVPTSSTPPAIDVKQPITVMSPILAQQQQLSPFHDSHTSPFQPVNAAVSDDDDTQQLSADENVLMNAGE